MVTVTFLGESIHGVSEFTRFKLDWIREADAPVVVFEADRIGLQRSFEAGDSAEKVIENFPPIHRTNEMLELLECVVERGIPYFGADVIPYDKRGVFEGPLVETRARQLDEHQRIYALPDPFPVRDEYMAQAVADCLNLHPEGNLIGLFHNLHIKKQGSLENGELKLASVAEVLRERHGYESRSIGLFAEAGIALHNNGTPFDFRIADDEVIESLAVPGKEPRRIRDAAEMRNLTAYHHAFEKENLPVRLQYDECVVFASVNPPSLLEKSG